MLRVFVRRPAILSHRVCARHSALEAFALAVVVTAAALPVQASKAPEHPVRVGIVIDGPVTRADLIETFRQ